MVIYLPTVPEAAVAMLACARLGAVHSVVFGGFAPRELAARIDDATPSVVVSASCGIEGKRVIEYKPLLDRAIELAADEPAKRVILQRPEATAELGSDDVDWAEAMATAQPADCVPVRATHPLYILYTSGTTGKPKGVVRDGGGHAVALAWTMRNVYDVGPGETMFTASDVGWVVGHSYIVYAPLLVGANDVLYEGKPVGTPDAGQFWRVRAEHGVSTLFTAPTAFRAIEGRPGRGAPGRVRPVRPALSLPRRRAAGPGDLPVGVGPARHPRGRPLVADRDGVADLREPDGPRAAADQARLPDETAARLGRADLAPDGNQVAPGVDGAIVVKLPMPPGSLPTLWNDDERFVRSYLSAFDGYYLTGDGGRIDDDGYVFVMGRTDDVINVAGHRPSTGGLEEALATHPAVAECAVIGVADPMKGQVPRGFVVLKAGLQPDEDELRAELVALVREQVGAVASLKDVAVVPALPKTRSGKILRRTMRGIADGADEPVPSTIDDPAVLDTLRPVLRPTGQ